MLFETPRFEVVVGVVGPDPDPQYLVKSKETGVVEFCNTCLYFVRDWAQQMDKALDVQDWEIAHPGQEYPDQKDNVIPFPGGKGGRSN